jgi:hypothetical protein
MFFAGPLQKPRSGHRSCFRPDCYYLVYPLSSEEAELADAWAKRNEEFSEKFGLLANDPQTKDSAEVQFIEAEWNRHRAPLPDFTIRPAVAWFCSGGNSSFYGVELA